VCRRLVQGWRQVGKEPPEWLIHDEPTPCVYLPSQTARLPLRMPSRPLTATQFAQRLEEGDRRQGLVLYRPSCPTCRACQPLRIDVTRFEPSRTQRRVFRRGEARLETRIGRPRVAADRVALYNRHKVERGLLVRDEVLDAEGYAEFLVESCSDSLELAYTHQGRIVGIAIIDRAADALSAVYCFFDPAYANLSPGAYSILKQIALCREWGLRYLYLGLYVVGCPSMAYKATYLPHERLIDGIWRPFQRERGAPPGEPP
jgi:arginyl-tRNA--protein-N-Asp/Glu arginylyltransferase